MRQRGSAGFLARHPELHHATRATAWPGIAAQGLLPAATLARRHDPGGADLILSGNRGAWLDLGDDVALRRQGMPDGPLRARLAPGVEAGAWRRFINEHVFLAPDVGRYLRADPGQPMIRLSVATEALLSAGCRPLWCRFNNGFLDRSPAQARRLRGFDDWQALDAWAGERVAEVIVRGALPPGLLRTTT